jgi:4-hydroxy-tetrahydrodipicolinate reductase
MSIRVLVSGAHGKMGQVTVKAIEAAPDLTLVATAGREDHLGELIQQHQADVVVDFTTPEAVVKNTLAILEAGARPVIGTTGFTLETLEQVRTHANQLKRGTIIAPNFSVGAILLMRFAQEAVKFFPDAEIIEMHHPKKLDAPSGTAIKTAALMAESRTSLAQNQTNKPAQGERHHDIPIHSVRLPGIFAEQTVLFGGMGEVLTLSHRASDREAMMPGVCLACREVMKLDQLIYGLEHLL